MDFHIAGVFILQASCVGGEFIVCHIVGLYRDSFAYKAIVGCTGGSSRTVYKRETNLANSYFAMANYVHFQNQVSGSMINQNHRLF